MPQTPPPQPPRPAPEVPAGPAVVPILPTRVRQPGRQAPLPDAVAVRRLAVPDPAPPFDDEILALTAGNEPAAAAAARPDAAGPPHDQDRSGPEAEDESSSPPKPPGAPGGQPPGGGRRPDPGGSWPSQFAQVLAETLAGSRPAQQLTPWPKVRRVMTSAPAAGVLEMTAVVGFGPRVRALALRLEREQSRPYRQTGDRWCCTAIESA
jgi:hypothetical protein